MSDEIWFVVLSVVMLHGPIIKKVMSSLILTKAKNKQVRDTILSSGLRCSAMIFHSQFAAGHSIGSTQYSSHNFK
ncbi:hypothetical protein NBRC116602_00070 [Hyphomicrobiales bacterium 4NK60-0047b]